MSVSEKQLAELVVGTRGWEHAQWLESYYPDDLPEDWRLGYYANEFACVVLPAELWVSADADVIEQWLEDVEDDFTFFLELPDSPEEVVIGFSAFSGRCGGAVLRDGKQGDWLATLGDIPLLISEDTGNLRCYRQPGQSETALAWLEAGPGEKLELPVLREQIELALKGVAATSRLAFIIGHEAPRVENLQNAQVLAELLGA